MGCEAYIRYIEAETKFDAKDDGKHATISKIEGKLKSGKCTIESKIEGKLKSGKYTTRRKIEGKLKSEIYATISKSVMKRENNITSSKFLGREWSVHEGSKQGKTILQQLLKRSEGDRDAENDINICQAENEKVNLQANERSVISRAEH